SAISSGVGFPASLAGMSATVPVAVPLGSGLGSDLGSSALTTLTSSTTRRTKEKSFHIRRMVCLLFSNTQPFPITQRMLGFLRPEIIPMGKKSSCVMINEAFRPQLCGQPLHYTLTPDRREQFLCQPVSVS